MKYEIYEEAFWPLLNNKKCSTIVVEHEAFDHICNIGKRKSLFSINVFRVFIIYVPMIIFLWDVPINVEG